jgi:hypothetical protein
MGKPVSERTHKKKVDKSNSNRSAETVRSEKNARAKSHNQAAKLERAATIATRQKRTASERLANLDKMFGVGKGGGKERKRFATGA